MEMLTNYEYTLDYTNDADGAAETWGVEGGHGIISAGQMLEWVKKNCGEACPGETRTPHNMFLTVHSTAKRCRGCSYPSWSSGALHQT